MTIPATDQGKRHEIERFRRELYRTFSSWGDALFELADAVLCSPSPVASVPALSLEPVFRRSHGSLYKALERGRIDEDRLRRLLVEHRPAGWPLVFAVDASTWDRCDAECSPERGHYYSASKHSAGQPIVAGWNYQWICQLNWAPDSWTAPLDVLRITPFLDPVSATVEQIRHLVGLLPDDEEVPLFVFDAGYDPIAIGHDLADVRCEVLTRIRDDRVFCGDPPLRPNRPSETGGRPPRHGKRFKCSDRRTWRKPDDSLVATDPRYGTVRVQAWHGLHPRLGRRAHWAGFDAPPIVKGSVIRVDVAHLPKPTSRSKKTLWLFWSGPGEPDLDRCWRAYLRRFDIEHTFRFMKGTLGWTTPSLCKPDQADRWSWLIAAIYTQLRIARGLVDDLRLPWERPRDPAQLTPTRVRRGFRRLRATIGTPASPPKSTTPGPGQPKGTRKPPRKRYPAVKRAA
ncbi:MAG TPA: NF041680 family putative transposase [Acidimicrobiales bacterium]|nr:NF041680 family putative transposase [Acidimicrobiales bacterium]